MRVARRSARSAKIQGHLDESLWRVWNLDFSVLGAVIAALTLVIEACKRHSGFHSHHNFLSSDSGLCYTSEMITWLGKLAWQEGETLKGVTPLGINLFLLVEFSHSMKIVLDSTMKTRYRAAWTWRMSSF